MFEPLEIVCFKPEHITKVFPSYVEEGGTSDQLRGYVLPGVCMAPGRIWVNFRGFSVAVRPEWLETIWWEKI